MVKSVSLRFRLLEAEYAAIMDCTDRIYHFTYSTDQSRTEGARGSLGRGRHRRRKETLFVDRPQTPGAAAL